MSTDRTAAAGHTPGPWAPVKSTDGKTWIVERPWPRQPHYEALTDCDGKPARFASEAEAQSFIDRAAIARATEPQQ